MVEPTCSNQQQDQHAEYSSNYFSNNNAITKRNSSEIAVGRAQVHTTDPPTLFVGTTKIAVLFEEK